MKRHELKRFQIIIPEHLLAKLLNNIGNDSIRMNRDAIVL